MHQKPLIKRAKDIICSSNASSLQIKLETIDELSTQSNLLRERVIDVNSHLNPPNPLTPVAPLPSGPTGTFPSHLKL